ncbi:chorismate mutase aro7 [Talaromyces marneffei ATCC 18224]|uniref:Chorismate mutase n=2 Tax=Talaromyces marneffei TaxID=37727 RepID=B6Q7S9_TALMQ|nr:chorismate mutase [Talaromyces marneffei ATCC 18224]
MRKSSELTASLQQPRSVYLFCSYSFVLDFFQPCLYRDHCCATYTISTMDAAIDLTDRSKALDLNNIRAQLIRLEDTITFHLIERAQFPANKTIYVAGGVPIPGSNLSLMDYLLREQEKLQSRVRRYESPDEHPFFPDAVEKPILEPLEYPEILHANDVNENATIKKRYIEDIIPSVCPQNRIDRGVSQENYGSSATCDVNLLQALSRRIHFGKFVAESKFQQETEKFVRLIKAADRKGIDEAITNSKVEELVLKRIETKAQTYGSDPVLAEYSNKVDAEAVVKMYKDIIIPITKVVEVEYLMQRLVGTQWE